MEFTKKDANIVAHNLVRVATCMASPHDFIGNPDCITDLIMNEML